MEPVFVYVAGGGGGGGGGNGAGFGCGLGFLVPDINPSLGPPFLNPAAFKVHIF